MYFPAQFYHELQAHKERQRAQAREAGGEWADNDLVFTVANGQPWDRCNLTVQRFKPLLRRAKLAEHFTLYSLRYTCATLSVLSGESDKVISR